MFNNMLSTVLGITATALVGISSVKAATSYELVQSSTGSTFFDNWIYYSGNDVNRTGNVWYLTGEQAAGNLTFVNNAGNVIIKVDNTTNGAGIANYGRNSINVMSTYTVTTGNLVLFDAVHLPFGVWPAFWSQGPAWPDDGEIDIIEGVNQVTTNSISLHTLDGCQHPSAAQSSSLETGNLISTDCFNRTDNDEGCKVNVPGNSYGQGFANNGGGVYALLWTDDAMSMWFFPRGSIPSDVPTSSPDPSGWGTPTAFYPSTSCDFSTFFKPQTLILDITICGNFGLSNFDQTCSGNCLDLVRDPTNYDNAYFEISYLKMFQQTNGTVSSTTSGSSTSATTSGSGTVTTTQSDSASQTSSGSTSDAISGVLALPLFSLLVIVTLQMIGSRLVLRW